MYTEKKSHADIAYDYIKEGIINKFFFPGTRLPEEDIVRVTGVSRTSVRAALARLKYEGIVEGTPNRGMSVTRYRLEDIRSVYQIRQALEAAAFELAVENITPDGIQRMREANRKLRIVTEKFSIGEFVKYNREFHWEIVLATHNRFYEKYLSEVYNTIAVCLLFYNSTVDDRRSLALHEKIIQALLDKDVESGKQAIIDDNACAVEDSHIMAMFGETPSRTS